MRAKLLANPDLMPSAVSQSLSRRILVVVQLSGGNDGLNTVVPYADPLYRQLRPQLGKQPIEDGPGLVGAGIECRHGFPLGPQANIPIAARPA